MLILEDNFKWHLEAFASELFIYIKLYINIYMQHLLLDHSPPSSLIFGPSNKKFG